MNKSTDALIQYRITRSIETLMEAEKMIENGFWNASINRIYYSCYYVVTALLLRKSIETKSHKGVRQMFGLYFVQKSLVSKDDGRFFSDLYDKRQTGDYGDFFTHDKEEVQEIFNHAI